MNITQEISVIYVSCDKYSDLWSEYFRLFRRYWPDCPFKVYVLSNRAGPSIDGVEMLDVGEDVSWSDNLLGALSRDASRYVFLLPDDFFLTDAVPNAWVVEKMRWAVERNVSYLRFSGGHPKPVTRCDLEVGLIPRRSLYRTSLRFTLWNKAVLQKILNKGESCWDFELAGSVRSDEFEGFYAVYAEPFRFVNCIIKGRWSPFALNVVRRRGAQLDVSRRRIMSATECVYEVAATVRSRLFFLVIPHQWRRTVRRAVLRLTAENRPAGSRRLE